MTLETPHDFFGRTPLVAILRGAEPEAVADVGAAIIKAGIDILEVTLNSPEPIKSIEILSTRFGDTALIGAGTVTTVDDVDRVADAGGRIIVSPNTNIDVIRQARRRGLYSLPGVFTPSEAFTALGAGADGLKVFPAEIFPPAALKAFKAVLPKTAKLFVVGGINNANMKNYIAAGATGFGIGSTIYKPNKKANDIYTDASTIVQAFRNASAA